MNMLAPLAALLGIEVEAITERVRNAIILYAVMIVLVLIGVVFLIVAGYLAIAAQVGNLYASLIVAAVFIVLALAVYLGSQISANQHKRQVAKKRKSSETSAFVTTAALTALPVLLRSPAVRTLGIPAAAIGLFLLARGKESDK